MRPRSCTSPARRTTWTSPRARPMRVRRGRGQFRDGTRMSHRERALEVGELPDRPQQRVEVPVAQHEGRSGACSSARAQTSWSGNALQAIATGGQRHPPATGRTVLPLRSRAMASAPDTPRVRRCTSQVSASWTTRVASGISSPRRPRGRPLPSQRSNALSTASPRRGPTRCAQPSGPRDMQCEWISAAIWVRGGAAGE